MIKAEYEGKGVDIMQVSLLLGSFLNGKKHGAFHGADRLTSHPISPLALALLQTTDQGTAG